MLNRHHGIGIFPLHLIIQGNRCMHWYKPFNFHILSTFSSWLHGIFYFNIVSFLFSQKLGAIHLHYSHVICQTSKYTSQIDWDTITPTERCKGNIWRYFNVDGNHPCVDKLKAQIKARVDLAAGLHVLIKPCWITLILYYLPVDEHRI